MRFFLSGILTLAVLPALAQGAAPSNVNECTLLKDAVELRRCIESFEGRGPAYAPPVATAPKPPPAGRKAWLPPTLHDRDVVRKESGRGKDKTDNKARLNRADPASETLDLREGSPSPADAESARTLEIR